MQQVRRAAARVVLLDRDGRVLLLEGRDSERPSAGTWWFTPGGGVEGDESLVAAARRELREETGLAVWALRGPVATREIEFDFEDVHYVQHESYFVARLTVRGPTPSATGWTDLERRSLVAARWWTLADLRATADVVHPDWLADLVGRLPECGDAAAPTT